MKHTAEKASDHSWQSAFKVMKSNFSLTDDSLGVFAINLRFNLDDIQSIASESIVGGGNDKKCDVLYVDKERAARGNSSMLYFSEIEAICSCK